MIALAAVLAIVAGGLGSVLRWATSLLFARRTLPWAVLTVNAAASAVGGAVLGLADAGAVDDGIRLILLSGVAGGLSTFSTFSVETIQLVQTGRWRIAAASVAGNLVVGLAFAVGGYGLVAALA